MEKEPEDITFQDPENIHKRKIPIKIKTQEQYKRFCFLNESIKGTLNVVKDHETLEVSEDSFYESILVLKKFLPMDIVIEVIKNINPLGKRRNMFFTPPKTLKYDKREQNFHRKIEYEGPCKDICLLSYRRQKEDYLGGYTDPTKKYYKTISVFCDALFGIVCDCENIGKININGENYSLPIKSKKVDFIIDEIDKVEVKQKTYHRFKTPLFLLHTVFAEKKFECDCPEAYYIGRLFKKKSFDPIFTDELIYSDGSCRDSKTFGPYLKIIKE